MAHGALRRAVFSWILLVLIAAGIGLVLSTEGGADGAPLGGVLRMAGTLESEERSQSR